MPQWFYINAGSANISYSRNAVARNAAFLPTMHGCDDFFFLKSFETFYSEVNFDMTFHYANSDVIIRRTCKRLMASQDWAPFTFCIITL